MVRLGLCCTFLNAPIRFRTTTVAAVARLSRPAAREKLADLSRHNARALADAIAWCHAHGIGCFRVTSRILPIKTHPEHGYSLWELPGGVETLAAFRRCRALARRLGVRLTFHPDQFVVITSERESVVTSSLGEIEYQAEVASWIGADVINVHVGGGYGDKAGALERFSSVLKRLSRRARSRLTVENDDRVFSPRDLLPLCRLREVPLVYDVHHHRCHPDGLSEAEATTLARSTWRREPLFHISSPLGGWESPQPRRHADFINPSDFPTFWRAMNITVEVEAKAKETAVLRLARDLDVTAQVGP